MSDFGEAISEMIQTFERVHKRPMTYEDLTTRSTTPSTSPRAPLFDRPTPEHEIRGTGGNLTVYSPSGEKIGKVILRIGGWSNGLVDGFRTSEAAAAHLARMIL